MTSLPDLEKFFDPRERYSRWYRSILEKLFPDRDAGYAILLITFPLLERYVFGVTKGSTAAGFGPLEKKVVLHIFKEELKTIDNVGEFWTACRHGLLHQVVPLLTTRSGDPLPDVILTHDIKVPISIEKDGSIVLQPVLFATKVLAAIEEDFNSFSGESGSMILPLPEVSERNILNPPSCYPDYPTSYTGTSSQKRFDGND